MITPSPSTQRNLPAMHDGFNSFFYAAIQEELLARDARLVDVLISGSEHSFNFNKGKLLAIRDLVSDLKAWEQAVEVQMQQGAELKINLSNH